MVENERRRTVFLQSYLKCFFHVFKRLWNNWKTVTSLHHCAVNLTTFLCLGNNAHLSWQSFRTQKFQISPHLAGLEAAEESVRIETHGFVTNCTLSFHSKDKRVFRQACFFLIHLLWFCCLFLVLLTLMACRFSLKLRIRFPWCIIQIIKRVWSLKRIFYAFLRRKKVAKRICRWKIVNTQDPSYQRESKALERISRLVAGVVGSFPNGS